MKYSKTAGDTRFRGFFEATGFSRQSVRSKAFTLIELLAVVAIIVILAALAFPVLSKTADAGNRAKCAGNLKNLASGVLAYVGENNGKIPYCNYVVPPHGGYSQIPWMRALAPYLGFEWTDENWRQWTAQKVRKGLPAVFYCPSDKGPPETYITPYDVSYGINLRVAAVANAAVSENLPSSLVVAQVPRPAQIILLGDSAHEDEDGAFSWRLDNGLVGADFSKRHRGGANIAWFDGHVTYVKGQQLDELRAQRGANSPNWIP